MITTFRQESKFMHAHYHHAKSEKFATLNLRIMIEDYYEKINTTSYGH